MCVRVGKMCVCVCGVGEGGGRGRRRERKGELHFVDLVSGKRKRWRGDRGRIKRERQ